METNSPSLQKAYKISNIVLIESAFSRELDITFEPSTIQNDINLHVDVHIADHHIQVLVTMDFQQKKGDTLQAAATIKMGGVFEYVGSDSISESALKEFGEINGAAIIFPYIREHLSNLSAKAGLGIILLPPFNFSRQTKA